jgi:hypothetical protein
MIWLKLKKIIILHNQARMRSTGLSYSQAEGLLELIKLVSLRNYTIDMQEDKRNQEITDYCLISLQELPLVPRMEPF